MDSHHPRRNSPNQLAKFTALQSSDPKLSGTFISVDPNDPKKLRFDDSAGVIGEFRGFTVSVALSALADPVFDARGTLTSRSTAGPTRSRLPAGDA